MTSMTGCWQELAFPHGWLTLGGTLISSPIPHLLNEAEGWCPHVLGTWQGSKRWPLPLPICEDCQKAPHRTTTESTLFFCLLLQCWGSNPVPPEC
jgi:hypothetical protein